MSETKTCSVCGINFRKPHNVSIGAFARRIMCSKKCMGIANRRNIIGERFGRLVVTAAAPPKLPRRSACWAVTCDCGAERVMRGDLLTSGRRKSCGCLQRAEAEERRAAKAAEAAVRIAAKQDARAKREAERDAARLKRLSAAEAAAAKKRARRPCRYHGATTGGKFTREYTSWAKMIGRCENANDAKYRLYGARGIRVCDRWRHDFTQFLADMGPRPRGTSIDRIDGNRGYEPGNCRWADIKTQNRNTNRNRLSIEMVRGIKVRLRNGERQASIANGLGINVATINAVATGRTWADVA